MMKLVKKMMPSCEEIRHICDKSQYGEATRYENYKKKFHFIICKGCNLYVITNTKLTELIKKINSNKLTIAEKNKLEIDFKKELNKQ